MALPPPRDVRSNGAEELKNRGAINMLLLRSKILDTDDDNFSAKLVDAFVECLRAAVAQNQPCGPSLSVLNPNR